MYCKLLQGNFLSITVSVIYSMYFLIVIAIFKYVMPTGNFEVCRN
jgi:hypothetical protein